MTAPPFTDTTLDWQRQDFARWLLRGLECWFGGNLQGKKAAFLPAIFDPALPARAQIADYIGELPASSHAAFRECLPDAIASWTSTLPHIVLRELLWMAAERKPIGLARLLHSLFVGGALSGNDEESEETRARLFHTMCTLRGEEVGRLLETMRRSAFWRPEFAAAYLRAQISATPGASWVALLRDLRRDLQNLAGQGLIDLSLTFELIVQDLGGPAVCMRDLPQLGGGDDRWIISSLIGVPRPVLVINSSYGTDWTVRFQKSETRISDLLPAPDFEKFNEWLPKQYSVVPTDLLTKLKKGTLGNRLSYEVAQFHSNFVPQRRDTTDATVH